jgi:hypothetical protein
LGDVCANPSSTLQVINHRRAGDISTLRSYDISALRLLTENSQALEAAINSDFKTAIQEKEF